MLCVLKSTVGSAAAVPKDDQISTFFRMVLGRLSSVRSEALWPPPFLCLLPEFLP